jgi:hypothetical protein
MPLILAAKFVLVPLLIGMITLAGARFGPRVAGVVTGLPVVAGPIAFVMALQQGAEFAARSATATLAGEASLAVFCVLYAATALRVPWWISTAIGWTGFAASTLALDRLDPALPAAVVIALATPAVVTGLTPRPDVARTASIRVPAVEIVLRMAAGVALMLSVTGVAHLVGPRLSGLLTIFPIATTILAAFTHRAEGGASAVHLLRGLAVGLYSLSAFFLTLAFGLPRLGTTLGFAAAATAAFATQAIVLRVVRRRAHAERPERRGAATAL